MSDENYTSNVLDNDSDISEIHKYKTDPNLGEDFINFTPVPSLESMALVNIVVEQWKHFREEVTNNLSGLHCRCDWYYGYKPSPRFLRISTNVSERLSLLSLPNLFKERARSVVLPIGCEMVNWMRELERCRWHGNSDTDRMDAVCFTAKGTIDKARTLELLQGRMEPSDTFNKACEYCLEDRIADLWERIPRETREDCFYTRDVFHGYDRHLIAYWTCFMKKGLSELMSMIEPTDIYDRNHSVYKNMFTLSIIEGKALAAKYFWHKLTDGERNNNVVEWTCLVMDKSEYRNDFINEYSDIMFFLLSQMNDKEQQRQVLHNHRAKVLRFLLFGWPWQIFLQPKVLQSLWDCLKSDAYTKFLNEFLFYRLYCKSDELVGLVFRGLWCNTPLPFRKHFIQFMSTPLKSYIIEDGDVPYYGDNYLALFALFHFEDTELTKLVLNVADVDEKKRIVSSAVESRILYDLIKTENVSLLDNLIREYLSSPTEYEFKTFKENKMMKYGDELCRDWIKEDNWQAVEKMLDWGFDSGDQVEALKAKMVKRMKVDDIDESCYYTGFMSVFKYILGTFKWSSFEGLINWCFNSDEEMNQFKVDISFNNEVETFMSLIMESNPDIEFQENFAAWWFSSEEEIVRFKKKLMFSETGLDTFVVFIRNHTRCAKYSEMVKAITKWFRGFEKEALVEIKKKIEEEAHKWWVKHHGKPLIGLVDCLIRGDTDWPNEGEEYCFRLDASDDDLNDSSANCTDASDDGCSSNQSSVSDKSDDHLDLSTGELIKDEFQDIDYNDGDVITLLDEILNKVCGVWRFCGSIWSQIVCKVSGFIFNSSENQSNGRR